jgi:hypothetical protein
MSPSPSQDDRASLQRQLNEARKNLRLIEERKVEYVVSTSIPLDLIRSERELRERIAELEQRLAAPPLQGETEIVTPAESRPRLREALLRHWKLLTALLALALLAAIIGLLMRSTPPCAETVRVIQSFTVRYPDTSTQSFGQGGVIEIAPEQQLLIEAILPESSAVQCQWSAGKGLLTEAKGCSIWYTPPVDETDDSLDVVAKSACRAAQANASLFVKVAQP